MIVLSVERWRILVEEDLACVQLVGADGGCEALTTYWRLCNESQQEFADRVDSVIAEFEL